MTMRDTVLVVEDEPDDLLLLQRAFKIANVQNPVKILRDGEEALKYLSEQEAFSASGAQPLPALVLLDIKLPRRSGLEVLEWIKKQPRLEHLPVIMLTSSQEKYDVDSACALGANAYLVKPVEFDELVQIIRTVKLDWLSADLSSGIDD